MEPVVPSESPGKTDQKPSFRKPCNDAINRKYRRHSPSNFSDSSSSGGSQKWSRSPDRDSNRNWSGRGSGSHRYSDRHTHGNAHDSHRHDEYSRHYHYADEGDRGHERSSRSVRDFRSGLHSDRPREHWRNVDKYSRGRSEVEHKGKEKERVIASSEHHRNYSRDSERARQLSRQHYSSRDDIRPVERERQRDRETRDGKREFRRSPGIHRFDNSSSDEEMNGSRKDSSRERGSGFFRSKETYKNGKGEIDGATDSLTDMRKNFDKDDDWRKEKYNKEADGERISKSTALIHQGRGARNEIDNPNSSAKKLKQGFSVEGRKQSTSPGKEAGVNGTSGNSDSVTNHAEIAQDLDAAKVAAMKAAELVNRNITGISFMSTDQKKKLLWGNKKNNASPAEPSNCWDLNLFSDRERQEKFNKLMGVKGEANLERRPDEKDVEKQKELQIDLEKQYTAGLRRRDGRTVGLGL